MKVSLRALTTIGTLALSGLATPASAIVTTYNSADQTGWIDTMISESEPTTQKNNLATTQMNGEASAFGIESNDAHMMVFSFGDLGIGAEDTINSATLNLTYNFSSTSETFTVWGFKNTSDTFDNNTLTWNTMQANTGFDPNNPSGTTYGSFTGVDGAAADSSTSIDLAAAIAAYIKGDITGIVIGTANKAFASVGTDNRVLFNTSEHTTANLRPSLMVDSTPIPEPATCALIFGLVALVGVVRRHRNHNSSEAMLPA